ncbi:Asp-tRNA(Asn)/Glu-tRNA(Gln) amidotransferase subunit GatB [Candidatus Woesearchaeota archaeon]|nr:Asp-tRNA(Asn)/Glu-tRNA(Gln) amidotransferase subunit GatB [Candidatus Woesearchaeota archaeon]MBT6519435.1 Asp-tRNA(Asn)/Glu-tRNA(Gln) amidotransferase subunit GatB [Candidatus Woesearchaeota archaeon]MBT7368904.1 Asp-tRNA(Asn)/Glu-tRNA(Gln) amidotransferase subunit GatB [Candidatus Woesearchaeota archaeon]
MNFTSDIVIGLEIHLQLNTKTKLFCSCSTKPIKDESPNSRTCPTCLGHPGSKPILNKAAIDFALKLALALNCKITPQLIFSRKSYFYPDLAKNYQITQYEIPLGENGYIILPNKKKVRINRVHMEEDPAALVHKGSMQTSPYVLADYNRSGNPLCEIVTEPDLESPEEAREFLNSLIAIVNYLNIFDSNHCIIKADANISIKESGYVRSEVKNISGFKEIERALFYEVERQKLAIKKNEVFVQDTRAWDTNTRSTSRLRTKETEADYGYILDPDLVVTDITQDQISKIKSDLPQLPTQKAEKFIKQGLKEEDAHILAQEKSLAHLFEKVSISIDPILAAKWLRHELSKFLNLKNKTFSEIDIDETHIIELLNLVAENKITDLTARDLLEKLIDKPFSPQAYVIANNLQAVSDEGELTKLCKDAIKQNPQAVEDFKAGNSKSFNFLVGKIMATTKGKASPAEVSKIIKELIDKN